MKRPSRASTIAGGDRFRPHSFCSRHAIDTIGGPLRQPKPSIACLFQCCSSSPFSKPAKPVTASEARTSPSSSATRGGAERGKRDRHDCAARPPTPRPHNTECPKLLREYVQIRLDITQRIHSDGVRRCDCSVNAIQEALWQQAKAVAAKDTAIVPTGFFIQTLNEMIDNQEKRLTRHSTACRTSS